jgi:transposase
MLLSEGQMSDYKGAALMIDALPKAKALLGDRGYDADWFRDALTARGLTPCIPSRANRRTHIAHDKILYRQRHKVENMFRRLKDWRRINTRYGRWPTHSCPPSASERLSYLGFDQWTLPLE